VVPGCPFLRVGPACRAGCSSPWAWPALGCPGSPRPAQAARGAAAVRLVPPAAPWRGSYVTPGTAVPAAGPGAAAPSRSPRGGAAPALPGDCLGPLECRSSRNCSFLGQRQLFMWSYPFALAVRPLRILDPYPRRSPWVMELARGLPSGAQPRTRLPGATRASTACRATPRRRPGLLGYQTCDQAHRPIPSRDGLGRQELLTHRRRWSFSTRAARSGDPVQPWPSHSPRPGYLVPFHPAPIHPFGLFVLVVQGSAACDLVTPVQNAGVRMERNTDRRSIMRNTGWN